MLVSSRAVRATVSTFHVLISAQRMSVIRRPSAITTPYLEKSPRHDYPHQQTMVAHIRVGQSSREIKGDWQGKLRIGWATISVEIVVTTRVTVDSANGTRRSKTVSVVPNVSWV